MDYYISLIEAILTFWKVNFIEHYLFKNFINNDNQLQKDIIGT